MNFTECIQFLELFAKSVGSTPDLGDTLNRVPQLVRNGQVIFQLDRQRLSDYVNGSYDGINLVGTGANGTNYVIGVNFQGDHNDGKITFNWN